MTIADRLFALNSVLLRVRNETARALKNARPVSATWQWLFGIRAIVIAAVLFLASAITLGALLSHLHSQFVSLGHLQAIVMQTEALEGDVADAAAAVHNGGAEAGVLLRIEERNSRRNFADLVELVGQVANNEMARRQLEAIRPLLADEFSQTRQSPQSGRAAEALAAFRVQQGLDLHRLSTNINRETLYFLALALAMALTAPLLGLIGISLLQSDRGNRRSRELQLELMHVQRLAVMGETAAMLAHEVSHPLTAANNYLAVLRRAAAQNDCEKVGEAAERAAQQIHRAATILHRLRRFIEKRDSERGLVAPSVLIQDAVALLGPLDENVTLITDIDPDLPDVAIDRIQIQQVLVNLIRNALDAMQGCAMRRLTIAAMKDGKHVEFSLADTGCGLPDDVAAKLFQPFISTKQNGMGVGLSICRSIVADHCGTIWAEANPKGGTIFRFRLPAA